MKHLKSLVVAGAASLAGLWFTVRFRRGIEPLPRAPRMFEHGDVVCFLGDSLTHSGQYHSYVQSYYLTRFPDRRITFVNCGMAGDTVADALGRCPWDVLPHQPSVVVVLFGLNDIRRSLYSSDRSHARPWLERLKAFVVYRRNLVRLVERVSRKSKPTLIFLTPSPYDETTRSSNENKIGVNAALSRCADIVIELAREIDATAIDFQLAMSELNQVRQSTEPSFSVIGPDRVHPGPEGHLVMAYLFLKAQRAPGWVSSCEIELEANTVVRVVNGEVADVSVTNGDVAFRLLEKALPFPEPPLAVQAMGWVPFEAELNQQVLTLKSGFAGAYRLTVDGHFIADYSAESLRQGVNLANNPRMPQWVQAQEVLGVVEERRLKEVRLRGFAQIKILLQGARINADNIGLVQEFFARYSANAGVREAYFKTLFASYPATEAERAGVQAELEALTERLWQINQPRSHHYRLARVVEAP